MTADATVSRTITIHAPRAVVFGYFTDSARFATWWGEGSTIEPRVGGTVLIRYPNGVTAGGEVLALEPDHTVRFSYGYHSGQPIPAGSTTVEIRLDEVPEGTRLHLVHTLESPAIARAHEMGWRYQLAVFAHVAARAAHAEVAERVDSYFALWSEEDRAARDQGLEALVTADVLFRDPHGCVRGLEELAEHVHVARRMVPATLGRVGDVAHGHDVAVAAWRASSPDGATEASGHLVVELAPDGRFRRLTGIWA